MATDYNSKSKLTRDLSISVLLYTLPVLAIYLYFKLSNGVVAESHLTLPSFLEFSKPVLLTSGLGD
jgi:hypothetical protein